MLIDNTYFQKLEGFIPNNKDVNAQPVGSPSVQSKVNSFIEKYERELMLNALGVTHFNELWAALADLPSADQKWKDLVEGKDYTVNGNTYRWDGLRGYVKESLVAFFVYSKYLRSDEFTYTSTGMERNESDNALMASYTNKDVIAWNLFIEQYQGDLYYYYRDYYNCLYSKNKRFLTYQESVSMYNYYTNNVQASLWQYLNDSNTLDPTAFPDFQFKIYPPRNRFGI